ncbi:MAG: InlB B-repeat-containing protein [Candidatus Saccharibacteria bacterium]|nr:InlB B-repeat-containing protein [Candidatus Saccharibacteria bacterium]
MNKTSLLSLATISSTIVIVAFLSSNRVSADNSVIDQINITVPTSCTMSGTGMNTHNVNVQNNSYTQNIGITTLHAFCNDTEGFAIYAVGYTDNEFGKTVLTSSTLGSTYDIVTGTADSGNTSNWAMKLAITQDSGDTTGTNAIALDNSFENYHSVPNTYTKVAHKNTSTDMTNTTGGAKLTTTYAALISANQPAGTYTGQVKYTLVHPASEIPLQPIDCPSGKICYNPNGGNVIGTMGQQSISISDTSATLLASNFSREGYGFAGWSDAYDYAANNNVHLYGPNEDISFSQGQFVNNNNGLALYAIWVKSAGSIQNWTGCSSLASGAVTALTDQRDNETYAVAKLADGNCWMIENLRLENTASHNSDGLLAQGYGTSTIYGNFSGLADPEAPWNIYDTTANSLYSTDGSDGTINIGTNNAEYRFPRYNNVNTPTTILDRPQNPTTGSAKNNITNAGIYSYGNYYTWSAAIADTTEYLDEDYKITSICPKGWQMPLGGTSMGNIDQGASDSSNKVGGFSYLDRKMGGTGQAQYTTTASLRWRKYPINFVYSGFIDSSFIHNRGLTGRYWSSKGSSSAFELYLDTSSSNSGSSSSYTSHGCSIRCLVSGL